MLGLDLVAGSLVDAMGADVGVDTAAAGEAAVAVVAAGEDRAGKVVDPSNVFAMSSYLLDCVSVAESVTISCMYVSSSAKIVTLAVLTLPFRLTEERSEMGNTEARNINMRPQNYQNISSVCVHKIE